MQTFEAFKQYYSQFSNYPVDQLDNFYAQHVLFVDPVHRIQGLKEMKRYFHSMSEGLRTCRFEFLQETVSGKHIWLKWCMKFRHSRLNRGDYINVIGATYLQLDDADKVCVHEDFYDMGSMLYEYVPVLGWGVKKVKKQLTEASC